MRAATIQGNPCKYGHDGLRYLKASGGPGGCVTCEKERDKKRHSIADPARNQRARERYLRRKFGITDQFYEDLLYIQGGRCAVCHSVLGDRPKGYRVGSNGPHVDHCHETGQVRAILCGNCNRGLGQFKDDPELLEKAAAYLRGFRGV